jgi:glucokinase
MFGTLEGLTQRDAIIERATRKVASGRKTLLATGTADRFMLTPKDVADAAAKDDEVALEVLQETGYYIGLGVASCINIFNPEVFVIGGGIAQAGDVLFDPIVRTARANAIATMFNKCKIVPADLGDNAGIMGGAALVAHETRN